MHARAEIIMHSFGNLLYYRVIAFFIGNILVIVVCAKKLVKVSETFVYVILLCASDCLLIFLTIPFKVRMISLISNLYNINKFVEK